MAHTTEHSEQTLEQLLDLIADALILSQYVDINDVEASQKFIRNGQLEQGYGGGVLALFQKDIEANKEDLLITTTDQNDEPIAELQSIADGVDFNTLSISIGVGPTISLVGGGDEYNGRTITDLLFDPDGTNPLNVSQFIPLEQKRTVVDVERAEEFLDTNIFELLPSGDSRQARINRFFQELNALLPPILPQFDIDGDGEVDRESGNWIGDEEYQQNNSISYAQDNPGESNIGEENAYVHRLNSSANDTNSTRTIQNIYNTILPYLTDILEGIVDGDLDGRPEYENQSSGYLKFRDLNQGIIIRNTNQDFIEGLDPSNPTWLTTQYDDLVEIANVAAYDDNNVPIYTEAHDFLLANPGTGFTITMWVKFLDKVSSGTLFNYGNPTRANNPFGFKLETYVLNKNDVCREVGGDGITFGQYIDAYKYKQSVDEDVGPGYDERIFNESDVARFVRLQVREFKKEGSNRYGDDGGLKDSHVGLAGDLRLDDRDNDDDLWNTGTFIGSGRKSINPGDMNIPSVDEFRLLQSTYIPEDFNEWYFICATYNPTIKEQESIDLLDPYRYTPDFWLNHVNPFDDTFVNNSGYGNKAKVEIISRSDLLRARGFKG
tara:strand:+ start:1069 stop:2886 length:1818 start_codon:yes stop_codon:yes gene_type:complete